MIANMCAVKVEALSDFLTANVTFMILENVYGAERSVLITKIAEMVFVKVNAVIDKLSAHVTVVICIGIKALVEHSCIFSSRSTRGKTYQHSKAERKKHCFDYAISSGSNHIPIIPHG